MIFKIMKIFKKRTQPGALHPTGRVDGVAEQAIAGHPQTDDTRAYATRVDACVIIQTGHLLITHQCATSTVRRVDGEYGMS